jgi:hypothetical protein
VSEFIAPNDLEALDLSYQRKDKMTKEQKMGWCLVVDIILPSLVRTK